MSRRQTSEYGRAFAVPCLGGLAGARCAHRLVARFGSYPVLRAAGVLRVRWSLGLAVVPPGVAGLLFVIAVQLALVTCTGLFSPVFATIRLELTPTDRIARTLTAWSVTGNLAAAGPDRSAGSPGRPHRPPSRDRVAGLLLLTTSLLLPRRP